MTAPVDLAKVYGCPLPPANLADRKMPVCELQLASTPLLRIHRSVYDPIYYNRRSSGGDQFRFDAAGDEFGVLYASPSFTVCMAETVIRGRFQNGADENWLDENVLSIRSVSELGFEEGRALILADLTKPLIQLGFDNRILSIDDYRGPNLWSTAIHRAFPHLDGLYFTSRYANGPSVAIFDRTKLVSRGAPVPLMRHPLLPGFLNEYDINLDPFPGLR